MGKTAGTVALLAVVGAAGWLLYQAIRGRSVSVYVDWVWGGRWHRSTGCADKRGRGDVECAWNGRYGASRYARRLAVLGLRICGYPSADSVWRAVEQRQLLPFAADGDDGSQVLRCTCRDCSCSGR